ncbi:MAG: T9SS type A sorting domain-containing protein [Cyclobacteriaceae bacterium]|nr:T9SS type A sorting domain-containing protein [Cyclobacteriaceae bacterium]
MSSLFIKHTLAANSPFFLSLLNLQGQEIIKMNFSNLRVIDLELDMYPLSAGIYILNLQSDSETITRKISVIK